MINKKVEMELPIETYDIDVGGHVNNIVFVRWLEELRTKLFTGSYSLKRLLKNNCHLAVLSTDISYLKQVRIFDAPIAEVKCTDIKLGIITFDFRIKVEDILVAVAEQKCAVVDLSTNKIIYRAGLQEMFGLL